MKQSTRFQQGLSLVELLISIVIGLFIITGVIRVLIDSKESYILEEETAYIQESARFLNDQLLYDLRLASFVGCPISLLDATVGAQPAPINGLPNADTTPHFSSLGVRGHSSDGDGKPITSYPSAAALPGEYSNIQPDTSVLVVNYAEKIDGVESISHVGNTVTFGVDPNASNVDWGETDDVMVIADGKCKRSAIFQQSTVGPNVAYTPTNLLHGEIFNNGSTLYRYRSHGYFVNKASPTTGLPALYRVSLGAGGNVASQELLSGVESMDVYYGIYDATQATPTIQYKSAEDVGTNEDDWRNVVSVHAVFVLRSARPVFGVDTNVDLSNGNAYLGRNYQFNDRFLRQLVTISTNLRNN